MQAQKGSYRHKKGELQAQKRELEAQKVSYRHKKGELETQLQLFLSSALERTEWSNLRPGPRTLDSI